MSGDHDELTSRAHAAWELKEFDQAAELFLQAAQVESEQAKARTKWSRPDRSILDLSRAGFCLWEGGRNEEATPLLQQATRFEYKAGRIWMDRYDAIKAYSYLLMDLAVAGDLTGFRQLWQEAVELGERYGLEMPHSYPCKRMMITACLELRYEEGLRHILSDVKDEALKNTELRLAVSSAKRFLSTVK